MIPDDLKRDFEIEKILDRIDNLDALDTIKHYTDMIRKLIQDKRKMQDPEPAAPRDWEDPYDSF